MSPFPSGGNSIRHQVPDLVVTLLRDLVQERTGIYFDPDRTETMVEKLESRVLANGCHSYLDYYYILKYDEKGPAEWRRVLDAFSVPETYFWRETDQIRLLVDHIIPRWFTKTTQPFRIWSAACATGEEPYSIAIALHEAGWGTYPIDIIASDASEAALEKARARIYRERSFRSLPPALREKYFESLGEESRLRPEIGTRVTFRWANLMHLAELPEVAHVDAIFCRNVFIYFSPTTISRVVGEFARRLSPGSPLFVGASESLLKLTNDFELKDEHGAFAYTRKLAA